MRSGRALLAIAVLLVGVVSTGADEGWSIDRFDIRYDIRRDGSIAVLEAIDVDFRGLSRHGIYRDIVYQQQFDEERNREYGIRLAAVTAADGRRHQVTEISEGDVLRFRIGDPDVTISGRQTYRVAYELQHALNGFADHDELYWNATGDRWPVRIVASNVVVTAPGGAIERVACYQGFRGSTEECTASFTADRAEFAATRPLDEGEQLTIVVGLRKGAIADPTPWLVTRPRDITRFFDRTPALVATMTTGFAAVIGGVVALWWRVGRDRRYTSIHYLSQDTREQKVPLFSPDPIAVEFEPPDNMRPAQLGLLLDERADTLDVTATIIDLAVRGYLAITEIPKTWWFGRIDWQLVRQKEADDALLPYERIVLKGLFGSGGATRLSELKNKFYDDLAKAEKSLYADAVNRGWFPRNPNTVRNAAFGTGIAGAIAGALLTMFLGRMWGAGLLGLPLVAGGLLLVIASRWMPRRTAKGREALRRGLGFARYIRTAEVQQHAFAERARIFTAYLPYAIALKAVDEWARAFKDIDLKTATAAWYSGPPHFDPGTFSTTLGSFSSNVGSTLSSTPGGSGSSGFSGGSSGGGGGGGGGGSW